ncbi:MAG: hypothetical protein JST30_13140 [Armatimonadetes bacterium]|nr:hypothetical protein [Armatimonadota bacterium]
MTVHVQLFGGFRVTVGGRPVELKGRTESRILARVCLAGGSPVSRRTVAADLWPDCDFDVSGNRLRTGLVGLRKALGPVSGIVADHRSFAVDPSTLSSDVAKALEAEKAAKRAFSDEERVLWSTVLAETTSSCLLPEWDDEWVVAARTRWGQIHVEACLQRCGIAVRTNDLEAAATWAGKALDADPYSSEAWRLWFQALAALGRGPEAARRFFQEREKSNLKGPHWADIDAAAKEARLSRIQPESGRILSLVEADFVQRTFARMLDEDPAAAARFLAHRSCGTEIEREPSRAVDLIERLISSTRGLPEHVGVRIAALRAHGLLFDSRAVQEHGAWILENDNDVSRLLGTHAVLAFDRILAGDWDRALTHAESALDSARRLGDPVRVWRALAQRASVHWHKGLTKEALEAYREAFEGLKAEGSDSVRQPMATIAVNVASVLAHDGLPSEAEAWILRARSLSGPESDELATFLDPLSGYVQANLGRKAEAASELQNAIVLCLRRKSRRQLEIGFEYTAASLSVWGDRARAVALSQWSERLRGESGHFRSPIEQAFVDRVLSACPDTDPDPEWAGAKGLAGLAKLVLARLEHHASEPPRP